MIDAVVFDLDAVLIDSERVWSDAEGAARPRVGRGLATRGHADDDGHELARVVALPARRTRREDVAGGDFRRVVKRLMTIYRQHLPLLPGAREAVSSLASRWPLGLSSSSNRPVIELVLDLAGFRRFFAATVSSEEVRHGKPATDVYLEAHAA